MKTNKINAETITDEQLMYSLLYRKIPGTRRANVNYEYNTEEFTDFAMCSLMVIRFAEKMGIKLYDYQNAALQNSEMIKFFGVHAARQSGMTMLSIILALHKSMLKGETVVLYTRTKASSYHLNDLTKDYYAKIPFYLKRGITSYNRKHLDFENGGRIIFAYEVNHMIGFNYNALVVESVKGSIESLLRNVSTMSALKDFKCIFMLSGNLAHDLNEFVDNARRMPKDPKRNGFTFQKVGWWENPTNLTESWYERQVSYIGKEAFDKEYDIH